MKYKISKESRNTLTGVANRKSNGNEACLLSIDSDSKQINVEQISEATDDSLDDLLRLCQQRECCYIFTAYNFRHENKTRECLILYVWTSPGCSNETRSQYLNCVNLFVKLLGAFAIIKNSVHGFNAGDLNDKILEEVSLSVGQGVMENLI